MVAVLTPPEGRSSSHSAPAREIRSFPVADARAREELNAVGQKSYARSLKTPEPVSWERDGTFSTRVDARQSCNCPGRWVRLGVKGA